jgi:ankyrin repeat protein
VNNAMANLSSARPLFDAAQACDAEELSRLVSLGIPVDSADEDGYTALHRVCRGGQQDVARAVTVLIDGGANVNLATKQGTTALHIMCFRSHGDKADKRTGKAMGYLTAIGADPSVRDNNAAVAMHYAAAAGLDTHCMHMYVAGAKPDIYDMYGRKPLDWAKEAGKMKTAMLLFVMEYGHTLQVRAREGRGVGTHMHTVVGDGGAGGRGVCVCVCVRVCCFL